LIKGTPGNFLLLNQIELEFADFIGAQLVGRFAEVMAELVVTPLASAVEGKKQANDCRLAHRSASRKQREIVTQAWSASAHGASCFP
jgi:hypothetical protein